MKSAEYEEILTSLQELTQRAYQLGRSEALKRVIEVMQADETPSKPLALMAPTEPAPLPAPSQPALAQPEEAVPAPIPAVVADADIAGSAPAPWWSRPVRSINAPVRGNTTTH